MPLFRFLSKKKETPKEELDIPPMPPPPSDIAGENIESIGAELPPLPDLEETSQESFKPMEQFKQEEPPEPEMPEPPEIPPEPEETIESGIGPEEHPIPEPEEPRPSIPGLELPEEIRVAKSDEIPTAITKPKIKRTVQTETLKQKPIFIKADDFKNNILNNINSIKTELKNSNQLISELGKLGEEESPIFKDCYTKTQDIRKKIVSIEKTIFKG